MQLREYRQQFKSTHRKKIKTYIMQACQNEDGCFPTFQSWSHFEEHRHKYTTISEYVKPGKDRQLGKRAYKTGKDR